MKKVLILFCLLLSISGFGQEMNKPQTRHFIQCRLNNLPADSYYDLEASLRAIPFIESVRLDAISKQALIVTKDLEEVNEELINKWLADYSKDASCFYIGIMGFDPFKDYSKDLCDEK